jgi:hypothetical protein
MIGSALAIPRSISCHREREMGEVSATKVDITAVREHSIGSRRTRAHVIVCHDLDAKRRTLLDLFRLVDIHPEAVDAIARKLALDIIQDANSSGI